MKELPGSRIFLTPRDGWSFKRMLLATRGILGTFGGIFNFEDHVHCMIVLRTPLEKNQNKMVT